MTEMQTMTRPNLTDHDVTMLLKGVRDDPEVRKHHGAFYYRSLLEDLAAARQEIRELKAKRKAGDAE